MGVGFEGPKGDKGIKGEVGPPGESYPYSLISPPEEVIGPIGLPGAKGDKVCLYNINIKYISVCVYVPLSLSLSLSLSLCVQHKYIISI
jgi:uncharacterized membrane protein YagU involved in acid resistance